MNGKRFGFTMVELLTALAIISMLVAVLIPSLTMVRNFAKETRQKAQFATIGQALLAFRADYGDYPPSDRHVVNSLDYGGAQKLTEALLGWDLLGFHPQSAWRPDGLDRNLGEFTYDPARVRRDPVTGIEFTLYERRGPYLDLATIDVFKLGDLYGPAGTGDLHPDTYVLCDTFPAKKVSVTIGPVGNQKVVTQKAGTPILYYKANISSRNEVGNAPSWDQEIYNYGDNSPLTEQLPTLKSAVLPPPSWVWHPLGDDTNNYEVFREEITDWRIFETSGRYWPHRPDSYILISAGADGLYGTNDDITNFGN